MRSVAAYVFQGRSIRTGYGVLADGVPLLLREGHRGQGDNLLLLVVDVGLDGQIELVEGGPCYEHRRPLRALSEGRPLRSAVTSGQRARFQDPQRAAKTMPHFGSR